MPAWLKGLVAVTCVAVTGYVGFYFWQEWSSHQAQKERAVSLANARAELFEFAKAKITEPEKVERYCKSLDSRADRDTELRHNEYVKIVLRNCRYFDFL